MSFCQGTHYSSRGSRKLPEFNNPRAVIDTALLAVRDVLFTACWDTLAGQQDSSSVTVHLLCGSKSWRRSTMQRVPAVISCTVTLTMCHADSLTPPDFSELGIAGFWRRLVSELLHFLRHPPHPGLSCCRSFVRGSPSPPQHQAVKTLSWWMLNCRSINKTTQNSRQMEKSVFKYLEIGK